jgi:hypothetical protein
VDTSLDHRRPGERVVDICRRLLAAERSADEIDRDCAAIPVSHVRLLPSDQVLPGAVLALPARAAQELARKRARASWSALTGLDEHTPDFELTFRQCVEGLEHFYEAFDWSDDASAVSRVMRRGPESFNAFLDSQAQVVVLAERSHALPRQVARHLDEQRASKIIDRLAGEAIDVMLHKAVKRDLARTVPTSALVLLERSGIRFHVTADAAELDGPHRRFRTILGDDLAEWMSPRQENAIGVYSGLVGELKMFAMLNKSTGHAIGTARHELCHAIDHALGKGGSFLSDEPEFERLYQAARERAEEAEDVYVSFPTLYASSSARELFAEAAACFLGPYFDERLGGGGAGDLVTTRDDLLRCNEGVYRFCERVFGERIPEVVAQNRTRPHGPAIAALTTYANHLDELAWNPFQRRSKQLTLACVFALRGRLAKDSSDERVAVQHARKANGGLWGRLFPDERAQALAARLESRLREASRSPR